VSSGEKDLMLFGNCQDRLQLLPGQHGTVRIGGIVDQNGPCVRVNFLLQILQVNLGIRLRMEFDAISPTANVVRLAKCSIVLPAGHRQQNVVPGIGNCLEREFQGGGRAAGHEHVPDTQRHIMEGVVMRETLNSF